MTAAVCNTVPIFGHQVRTLDPSPIIQMRITMQIFVFGSNLAGIHGARAAYYALMNEGAIPRKGSGLQGTSYAIPTKDEEIRTMPLEEIRHFVEEFKEFAAKRPDLNFKVTQIGCGLAGHKAEDIAPMFLGSPSNCMFDTAWKPWLEETANFWGTF